jgi:hypothetical protein
MERIKGYCPKCGTSDIQVVEQPKQVIIFCYCCDYSKRIEKEASE